MLQGWVIVLVAFAYLCLLFAIAFYGDKRADQGRSLIASPYVYVLSLTVYATAWTFYGSVGRTAADGMCFLPIYLGPTLMAILWYICLRKIIRISKVHRITSLADFIGSRYGKSGLVAGLVTIIAVVGMLAGIGTCAYYMVATYPFLRNLFGVTTPITDLQWFGINPISAGVFGVPVGFATIVIVSLLTRAPERDVQDMVDNVRYPSLGNEAQQRAA